MAFTDDFNGEASTVDLQDHTPSGGTAWTRVSANANAISVGTAAAAQTHPTVTQTTPGYYLCDDQGSADNYIQARAKYFDAGQRGVFLSSRLVDADNHIGFHRFGTGTSGGRLTKVVAGVATYLVLEQGTDEEWVKVEVDGSTAKLFVGGTGATPSWVQEGVDQTYSENTTETSQGIALSLALSIGTEYTANELLFDDFEAGSLGVVVSSSTTGTAVPTQTEADVVTGGKTIILTLTGDTWVAAGATFDAQRQNIIDGLDSAQSELTGWNAEVRNKEVVGAVVRTSDTIVTITLTAAAAYDITATETITATIPATALVTSASAVISSPTFTVTAAATGISVPVVMNHLRNQGIA